MKQFNYKYDRLNSITSIINECKYGLRVPADFKSAVNHILGSKHNEYDLKILAKYKILFNAPVMSWVEQILINMKRNPAFYKAYWQKIFDEMKVLDM